MSGYHNVVLETPFSAGSTYLIGFDSRVIELESGQEEVIVRSSPWGRRRYVINRGNLSREDIYSLAQFYVLRNGAANAFKYLDNLDSSTNTTGSAQDGTPPTAFDVVLEKISDQTYQCVRRYSDTIRTVVRLITKIVPGSFKAAVEGTATNDYTLDLETGIVTFGATHVGMLQATAGFDYYTVVRFGDSTDQAFSVTMQAAPGVHNLPNIELVEVIQPKTISQDYQYGGSTNFSFTANAYLTESNGRVQKVTPLVSGLELRLPLLSEVPLGAPIFLVNNIAPTTSVDIVAEDGTLVYTLGPLGTVELAMSSTNNGSFRNWIAY